MQIEGCSEKLFACFSCCSYQFCCRVAGEGGTQITYCLMEDIDKDYYQILRLSILAEHILQVEKQEFHVKRPSKSPTIKRPTQLLRFNVPRK